MAGVGTLIVVTHLDSQQLFREHYYDCAALAKVLQCMGCRRRHVSKMAVEIVTDIAANPWAKHQQDGSDTVHCSRDLFEKSVTKALRQWCYAVESSALNDALVDFNAACSLVEKEVSVFVLMAGTSGTGKSTLASLIAGQLGVKHVISTDSIRHTLRTCISKEECPVLYSSTYQAGATSLPPPVAPLSASQPQDSNDTRKSRAQQPGSSSMCASEMTEVEAYIKQAAVVCGVTSSGPTQGGLEDAENACYPSRIDAIISSLASRGESAVIEGVHLTPSVMIHLMERHRNVVPFLLYIKQEQKHRERFAVRAKHMTLMPAHNRYVKHIKTIRAIQSYLLSEAELYSIPRLSNSNIDRSVSIIHGTIFAAIRKLASEKCGNLVGTDTNQLTAEPLYRIFKSQIDAIPGNSKKALQQIERKKAVKNSLKAACGNHEEMSLHSKPLPHSPTTPSRCRAHDSDNDVSTIGFIETEAEADYEDPIDDGADNDTDFEIKRPGNSPILQDMKQRCSQGKFSIWNRARGSRGSKEKQRKSPADEDSRGALGRQTQTETDEGSTFEFSDEVSNGEELYTRFIYRTSSSLRSES